MIKKRDSQNRPEQYYSEMLLRQYPWLKDKLKNEEYPIAFSHRKPETLLGLSLVFIGLFVVFDTLFHTASFGNALFVILSVFIGAALFYGGLWAICFAKRSYILVTSERVLHQKTNWIGQPGKEVSISRNEIRRVRFLKSTVMYRVGRSDGGIAIEMKNGRTVFISSVLHGENIFDALR